MHRFPFLIIVDDGGFDYAIPGDLASLVDIDAYSRIADLGRQYGVRIPICFSLKYLDVNRRSKSALPLSYADDLMLLLQDNSDAIEFAYHGLYHEFDDGTPEFFDLVHDRAIPEDIQRSHMEISREILNDWGLEFPELFVPPYNAWEQNVTDRIAAEFGVKFLVGYRFMRFQGHSYKWNRSRYLRFLPRTSLGLNGRDYSFSPGMARRLRVYPGNVPLRDYMIAHIVPQNLVLRLRVGREFRVRPVHSYMTHIGNFSLSAMDYWKELFDFVQEKNSLQMSKSSEDAARVYWSLVGKKNE